MTKITEAEFARIVLGLIEDRESIIKHNPIADRNETLLWMLLSCLNSYLSLTELEMPCFTGIPDENTYRDAVIFVLRERRETDFDAKPYLDTLTDQ